MKIPTKIPFSLKPTAQASGRKGIIALTVAVGRFSVAARVAADRSLLSWLSQEWASRDHWPEALGVTPSDCPQRQLGGSAPLAACTPPAQRDPLPSAGKRPVVHS